jgi:hypothetical protein
MDGWDVLKVLIGGILGGGGLKILDVLLKHIRRSRTQIPEVEQKRLEVEKRRRQDEMDGQDYVIAHLKEALDDESDRHKRILSDEEKRTRQQRELYAKQEEAFNQAKDQLAELKATNIILTARVNQCLSCPQDNCPQKVSHSTDPSPNTAKCS